MPFFDHSLLSLVVRWLHVAGMAALLGGALLLWAAALRSRRMAAAEQRRVLLFLAEPYEYLFWVALGLQVVSGVGNLGALAPNVPAPGSAWGDQLLVKLLAVLALLLLSFGRTLAFIRLALRETAAPAAALSWFYGATALALAVIALLAVWLAHA